MTTPVELDPQARAVIDAFARMNLTPPHLLPVAQARAQFMQARVPFTARAQEVAAAHDIAIPGPGGPIRVRLYRPWGSQPTEPLPALIYFHGGGWVFGDLDSHDSLCRALCNGAECVVAAVDYRLAPEHKFPAAVEDAFAAIRHIAGNAAALGIDATRIAAGGDSAGGNLVAVAAIEFRDRGGPRLQLQLLLYPVTDLSMDTVSYRELGEGYLLTFERMQYFRAQYLRSEQDIRDWRASPLLVQDMSNLPPALIITASHDPLVDEGKAYAERLAAAGVPVEYRCYGGVIHGFLTMAGAIHAGTVGTGQIVDALKRAFTLSV
jgi:acetyl esterase